MWARIIVGLTLRYAKVYRRASWKSAGQTKWGEMRCMDLESDSIAQEQARMCKESFYSATWPVHLHTDVTSVAKM